MRSDMQWLEMINIRLNGNDSLEEKEVFQQFINSVSTPHPELQLRMFQHATLPSDFSFLIVNKSEPLSSRGSEFGIQLAWLLEEYGVVNHSVWLEKSND